MFLGFSNGAFYPLGNNDLERFLDKETDLFKVSGKANALELHPRDLDVLKILKKENSFEKFRFFEFISLHAPFFNYEKNESSRKILDLIREITKILPIKNIVFHPNWVKDWEVFLEYQDLPLSLENMDSKEKLGGLPVHFEEIFKNYPFLKFTMDLQHCYCVDPTLKIVDEFYKLFSDRLVEYHLSSFDEKTIHSALFKYPEQSVIINSIPDKNIPIILESCFTAFDEAAREFDYVYKLLQ